MVVMWWLGVLLVAVMTAGLDEDLQFDDQGVQKAVPVRRLWGVPDQQAVVGQLFVAAIPGDAFSGDIQFYEPGPGSWPRWLELNHSGEMKGVPTSADVGVVYLMVRAVGPNGHHYSNDIFAVDIIKPGLDSVIPDPRNKGQCPPGVDPIMLTMVLDVDLKDVKPSRRVAIIETISRFYALPQEMFYLRELVTPRDLLSLASLSDVESVIMAGPGNVKPHENDQEAASLSLQIGCGREIRKEMESIVARVREDAADGTAAEVLQTPLLGWHVRNELPAFFRDRRDVAGSGDFYEEEDDEEDYGEPLTTQATPHPHRHHHGEETLLPDLNHGTEAELIEASEVFYQRPSHSLLNYDVISTPAFIPERPTIVAESTVTILPTRVTEIDLTPSSSSPYDTTLPEPRAPVTVPILVTTNEVNITDVTSESSPESSSSSSSSSSPSSFSYPSSPSLSSSSSQPSSPDVISVFANHSWTTTGTTEEMEPETRNFVPTIAHRLKKVAVVAGKVLRFVIPENTFMDIEDGTTRHMMVSFTTLDRKPLPLNSWIMFNQSAQEITALPLEEHVSKWEFLVEARDKDGDVVSDTFEIQVQQHKSTRTVNHEVTLSLTVARTFTRSVEWQLRVLQALTNVYGDKTQDHITVRAVSVNTDPVSLTWTNDSLPRTYCPREDIDRLLKVISVSEDGYPASVLQEALGPGITVRRVTYQGIENCEMKQVHTPPPPPEAPNVNYAPVPRNQIDQINATAGQLLIFRVPEDTFYDPEDGGTRKLKMSLLHMDRSPLASSHWLQFDAKNQEFYGLPMDKDVRSQEYQLVCEDRAGLAANDGLLVVVRPRAHPRYNVEFSIALDVSYDVFINNANLKRKFVEKLQEVFGDSSADSVVIASVSSGSTIIKWFNSSLPTDHCPEEQIHRLRRFLINDNEVMSDRLVSVMGSEFPVISVGLEPAGECEGELTVHHRPEVPPPPPIDESHPLGGADNYMITFVIPASVIALMLILAGLIACLFYRKRQAGKMGIGDEDERQSFRSKGIPVIFQDELEEKPEPENKNPVIMKEEKPPLPPPEYQRNGGSEDTPYHPPPPFPSSRDSGRHTRPKPTPTYRKPPPYVPP